MKPQKLTAGRKIGLICVTLAISNAMVLGIDPPAAIAQETISEVDIVTFISKMEYYTNEGNVDELVKYIDEDASLAIASEIGVEPALVRIDNLRTFFNNGFEGLDNYKIDLNIDSIAIEGQVATVKGTTVDRSVKGNIETISNILWRNVIEMQDGELKIIQWESLINGYSVRAIKQEDENKEGVVQETRPKISKTR